MITIKELTSPSKRQKILEALWAFNSSKSPYLKDKSNYYKTVDFYAEESKNLLGGALCIINYNWIYIDYLYVNEQMRGQDIGTKLINKIEQYAKENNLTGLYTETFDFQARPFYEKNGFKVIGCYENMPPNSKLWLLQKAL